jgi:acetate kinase
LRTTLGSRVRGNDAFREMADHLLTLNAGSSSIKFALFRADLTDAAPRVRGIADGLGATARLRIADGDGWRDAPLEGRADAPTHADALAAVLRELHAVAADARIVGVGHRIVHGGAQFDRPVVIDEAVLQAIRAFEPLAPLHQPHNVAGVLAAMAAFPGVPQVACFDTAFHRTQPQINQRFALPRRLFDAGVRRYGFHGLSYESIVAHLDERAQGRVIVAHLGNGASLAALRDGRSVATTMSFSPLDGLPMGTRCGRLDAAVVLHLLQREGMSAERIAHLLYRESGLAGLSGLSGDMRELEAANTAAAREAIDYFVEHVLRELAAMAAALRGVDRIVFTGGIGENATDLRQRIVDAGAWLGWRIDAEANRAGRGRISAPDSSVEILVLHTNEEAVIARHTARCIGRSRAIPPAGAMDDGSGGRRLRRP